MKFLSVGLTCLVVGFLFHGCLAVPVERTGGPGSVTIPNTNVYALTAASRNAFARRGYHPGPGNFPEWIVFQGSTGQMAQVPLGGGTRPTTLRVQLQMVPLPGSNDYRLIPSIFRVDPAGQATVESDAQMLRALNSQFRPIMRDIKREAGNQGPSRW